VLDRTNAASRLARARDIYSHRPGKAGMTSVVSISPVSGAKVGLLAVVLSALAFLRGCAQTGAAPGRL
jgi:hypothetical protein